MMDFAVRTAELKFDGNQRAHGVWVAGEVDVFTAPRLRETLLELAQQDVHHIVLDLTGVVFMDSVGLGVLIGALRRARDGGGNLVLCGISERLRRVLEITGLGDTFPLAENVDQGLRLLGGDAAGADGRAARGGRR